jgi:hypothetical protein
VGRGDGTGATGAAAGATGLACPAGAVAPRCTSSVAAHTVQRARMPLSGTFAGSTRNTVRQDGQRTFIVPFLP